MSTGLVSDLKNLREKFERTVERETKWIERYEAAEQQRVEAMRIISEAMGHPFKGDQSKTFMDLAKLAAQRLRIMPPPALPADAARPWVQSDAEKAIGKVYPEWFVHHVAGLMAPNFWAVDTPIAVGETREEAIRAASEKAEHIALERGLAYDNASSTIDCNCTPINLGGEDDVEVIWYDTTEDQQNTDYYGCITDALKYLEARGLIQRHATRPELVQVLEESEAMR